MSIVTLVEFDGKPPLDPSEGEYLTLASLRDRYLENPVGGGHPGYGIAGAISVEGRYGQSENLFALPSTFRSVAETI